jgi:LysM repeat protein
VLNAFFSLLLQKAHSIESKSSDINIGSVLQLKSTNQVVVFSEDSHKTKAKLLIKSLAKQTMKTLSQANSDTAAIYHIAMFVSLVAISEKQFKLELTQNIKETLTRLIKSKSEATCSAQAQQLFAIAKFLRLCNDINDLQKLLLK